MMAEIGTNLGFNNFFTFKYPGREPKSTEQFLSSREDIRSMYIYDLLLSTGGLMYSCAGGIGITKEPHIVDMHLAIKAATFATGVKEKLSSHFKNGFTRPSYLRLRETFNLNSRRLKNLADCINLYSLWICSNFTHKYKLGAYDGIYLPSVPSFSEIKTAGLLSREKNLLFRKENFYSFSESIINDNVVLYAHLPDSFGRYGNGFVWNKSLLAEIASMLNELSDLGYKVCVSAKNSTLGVPSPTPYADLFPTLPVIIIEEFKVSELTSSAVESDIYLLNF
jgi:hypothetical protein